MSLTLRYSDLAVDLDVTRHDPRLRVCRCHDCNSARAARVIATQPDSDLLAEALGLVEYDRVVGNGDRGAARRHARQGSISGTRRGK